MWDSCQSSVLKPRVYAVNLVVFTEFNFDLDLYLIKNDELATLLKDSRGFYDFLSPLQSSVEGVKLSWFSSPQVCVRT